MIKYQGKEIPFVIDYGTLKRFQKETGTKLTQLEESINDFEVTEKLFWHAIQRGYNLEGKDNPYKRDDMENILSENGVFPKYMEIFGESLTKMFTPEKEGAKKTSKKK